MPATQKQIREWLPENLEIFFRFMPPCPKPPPKVYVCSEKTFFVRRRKLTERLRATKFDIDEKRHDAMMELIHGDLGDAILIRQPYIASLRESPMAHTLFQRFLWHELGHYYAINCECSTEDLHRFNDPANAEDPVKQEGYWFWSEFVAEAISFRVDELHCRIDNKELYHPERITWESHTWGYIPDRLLELLDATFGPFSGIELDSYPLALYFAALLTDDVTKRYVQAAYDAKLQVYDKETGGSKPMAPGSSEPTCISDQDEEYQETLWALKAVLEERMKKERFWEIDGAWMRQLGEFMLRLSDIKQELIEKYKDE